MTVCRITDIVSWFSCAEASVPFTELLTIVVFFVFFLLMKNYPLRESLPPSLFIATLVAAGFLGMGLINSYFVIGGIVLTAISAVFLYSQNNPY